MVVVSQTDFEAMWSGGEVTEQEWTRITGYLRRASRELVLLIGGLEGHDQDLVKDTLIDAVIESQLVDNPNRFASESDGGYSYTRYSLPSGHQSRFWWPSNLLELFGKRVAKGELRMRSIRPSRPYMGWLG